MPEFLTILALYYACDQAAMQTVLSPGQAAQCVDTYSQVKAHFLTQDELDALAGQAPQDRIVALRQGYPRFKAWEIANPDTVRDARAAAGIAVAGL